MRMLASALIFLLGACPASAAVKAVGAQGFEVADTVTIQASAAQVYAALGQVGRWWNPEHTYSQDASNLSVDLTAGGCFCEKTKAGLQAQHLVVAYVQPGKTVRLRGALGPLQGEGVDGALTWTITPTEHGVEFGQDYIVGGYLRDGSAKWAPAVDAVLHEQLTRLKAFLETGAPSPADGKPK